MTSTENGHDFDKIDMKTEINIDDEILFVNGTSLDDLQVLEPSSSVDKNLINGGIYFFEPQSIHITANNKRNDQKTDKLKNMEISCVSCDNRLFMDKHSLEAHHKNVHEKRELLYGCTQCDYSSKKYVLLKNHFKKHIVAKNLQCGECLEVFAQKNELNYHKTTVHNIKICRKCNMEFVNFENYMQHKNNNHDDLQASKTNKLAAPLECPDCGKILMTQGGMITHRKMHSEAPKYKCEACQKEFFQKVNLVNHAKTHNIQNRSYSCTKCDKKFFEKSHLQRHQNFHNISRDFQCPECHKFYKTERCLKVHKQVHNPVHMRPFRCQEVGCNKSFLSSSKLKQHGNIHTNTRPFQCKHCPRDFTNYPNLLKHTIRRHKVDHRTGKPLSKIPDYVTNKKKKKIDSPTAFPKSQDKSLVDDILKQEPDELNFNVIHVPDDDDLLPRGFQLNVGEQNYDSMSILMDIDQEFSDFQLLSPSNDCNDQQEETDIEQFSIIDTTDLQFFSSENSINSNMIQLVRSSQ